jgi:glycerate 2-kinase
MWLEYVEAPLVGDVRACAERLVDLVGVSDAKVHGTYVAWGEPTLRVPEDHGEGGRAQQLALLLAKALRGTNLIAMAIGSDGIDGPPPKGRAAPAGAIVDGSTWDAIVSAGHDPERALARCDAGTVLDAVGALVVTGPTGINHGDLVVIGDRRE